jgi:hypothetical protein
VSDFECECCRNEFDPLEGGEVVGHTWYAICPNCQHKVSYGTVGNEGPVGVAGLEGFPDGCLRVLRLRSTQ